MRGTSDTSKRPVNLSINARTLELAKELGMNLSQTVDSFLTAEVQRRYWERWNDANKEAINEDTLNTTGRAIVFTGFTLALGVVTWVFSPIKFQADMGLLLAFMFIWNMIGAIVMIPVLLSILSFDTATKTKAA